MLIARTFVVPITEVGQATSEAERHRLAEPLSLEMIRESHKYWLISFLDRWETNLTLCDDAIVVPFCSRAIAPEMNGQRKEETMQRCRDAEMQRLFDHVLQLCVSIVLFRLCAIETFASTKMLTPTGG